MRSRQTENMTLTGVGDNLDLGVQGKKDGICLASGRKQNPLC